MPIPTILNAAERLADRLISGGSTGSATTHTHQTGQETLFRLEPFIENEYGLDQRYGFLHRFISIRTTIDLIISGTNSNIALYARVPSSHQRFFHDAFYIHFPTSTLTQVSSDTAPIISTPQHIGRRKPIFKLDTAYRKDGTYLDPLPQLLSIFHGLEEGEALAIQYTYRFGTKPARRKKLLRQPDHRIVYDSETVDNVRQPLPHAALVQTRIRRGHRPAHHASTAQKKHQRITRARTLRNVFSHYLVEGEGKVLINRKTSPLMLPLQSITHLFHMPTHDHYDKHLHYLRARKLPAPPAIATLDNTDRNDITVLGSTDYKNVHEQFGIRNEDKLRHMYIVGKTGMGKSTFISNMVRSDMISGKGVGVIDPHGDLIDTLLEHVPSRRTNDVVLMDITDKHYPIGINLFAANDPEHRTLVASGIVDTFKKLYAHSRGPRLEYILRNATLTLLSYPHATLLHLPRLLKDDSFRKHVLQHCRDPILIAFWTQEFDKRQQKFKSEAIDPIINKVGQFLSSSIVRHIFGQPHAKFSPQKAMDSGKIVLVKLAKGHIGEDNAAMIGAFLVTKFQLDALARAAMPESQRRPFYLYIDEFQNFATESFATVFSEARKYKLSLLVANQYIAQLEESIRHAIFGNVGSIISFGLGHDDAQVMASQFKQKISPNDLLSLGRGQAYTRLMLDGTMTDPFSMISHRLAAPPADHPTPANITKQSRERYAIPARELEQSITERAQKSFSATEKAVEAAKKQAATQSIGTLATSLTIGERYDGIVKLKYNYGLFVMVGGHEGLLHKKAVLTPEGVSRKKLYEIGDSIRVKASDTKEIDGDTKYVWTQLSGEG